MQWKELKRIPRFLPVEKVFERFSGPKFKLGKANAYYMGNGFLLGFSDEQFRIENMKRIEFGGPGQFSIQVSFFAKRDELCSCYRINSEMYDFESDLLSEPFRISDKVNIGSTFEQVSTFLKTREHIDYYDEGETRALVEGKSQFCHIWIHWNNYELLFFGRSKKTKLSAVHLSLKDRSVW